MDAALTPTQQRLLQIAKQRQQQAPAQQTPYQSVPGHENVPDNPDSQFVSPWWEGIRQYAFGGAEGLGDYAAPFEFMAKGGPTRLVANGMLRGAEYLGAVSPETADSISDYLIPDLNVSGNAVSEYLPETTPGYEGIRKSGRFTGQNIPGGIAGMAKGGAWNATKQVGKEVMYGALGAKGDTMGREMAAKYFPDSWLAQEAGGALGNMTGQSLPNAVGLGKAALTKTALGSEHGRETFEAARRLGIEDKVAPATFGNPTMKTVTQAVSNIPFIGRGAARALENGPVALEGALTSLSNDIRGGQLANPNGLDTNIQAHGQNVANLAEQRLSKQMEFAETPIAKDPIPVTQMDGEFNKIYNGDPADPTLGPIGNDFKKGVQDRESSLEADRINPINPQLHATLEAQIAQLEQTIANAQQNLQGGAQMNVLRRLQPQLDAARQAHRDNLGPIFSQLKQWTGVNRVMADPGNGQAGIGQHYAGRLTDAGRTAMKDAANAHSPQTGGIYNNASRQYDQGMNFDTGYVTRINKGMPDKGTAVNASNWLVKDLNKFENFDAMERATQKAIQQAQTPQEAQRIAEQWAQIRGDIVDDMGTKSAGKETVGSRFSPQTMATSHADLTSDTTKNILTGGDISKARRLDDVGRVSKGMKATNFEANTSNTAKHAFLYSLLGGGAGATVGNILDGSFLQNLSLAGVGAATAPLAIGKAVDRFVSNPQTSRDLVYGAFDKKRITDILKRAQIAGTTSASGALADEFGGPR